MRFSAAALALIFALFTPARISAQGLQVDLEEFRRLVGEVADLRDANSAQQKRISALQKEVDHLRDALRDSQEKSTSKMGDFATREDLKKIVDQIKEVDQRREADRKLILQEFENLGKAISQPVKQPKRRDPEPEQRTEPEKPIEGTFLPYTIKPNESLSEIQANYNAELKRQGLPTISQKQILQANPKLNPNRIFSGQTIQLPVPEKKK